MDRDIKLLGLAAAVAAVGLCPNEISAYAVAGADVKNKDLVPAGRVVQDAVNRSLLDEEGIDPDTVWFPPAGDSAGEMTLNEMVEWQQKNSRGQLASWLPEGKGTARGELEVDLANSLVYDLFPVLSEPGAEWATSLGPAEKLVHDLLNEDLPWPDDLPYEEQIAYVQGLLEEYAERG